MKSRSSWSRRAVALALAGLITVSGCAEVSRMTTNPEGANIYVNGILVGTSPTTYRYRSGLPETYYVKIEKPGYKTVKDASIDRSFRADVSLVLLVLAIVPYFFSARLEDQYVWNLLPEEDVPENPLDVPAAAP